MRRLSWCCVGSAKIVVESGMNAVGQMIAGQDGALGLFMYLRRL